MRLGQLSLSSPLALPLRLALRDRLPALELATLAREGERPWPAGCPGRARGTKRSSGLMIGIGRLAGACQIGALVEGEVEERW